MIKFDLKSAYHHIAIAASHRQYLGFQWNGKFFWFCALPIGLATAPLVFNMVTKPLIVHWRKLGFRTFLYYDDGSAAAESVQAAEKMASTMRRDLNSSGFIVNEAKFQWVPCQVMEYEVDLSVAVFRVTKNKAARVIDTAEQLLVARRSVHAHSIASFVGLIQSLQLAIGPSTSVRTRSLYEKLAEVKSFDHHVHMHQAACKELEFWIGFFHKDKVQFPIQPVEPNV